MTTYQNKEAKKYLAFAVVFLVAATMLMGCMTAAICARYREDENQAILALLSEALRQNPEADLQQFINILNENGLSKPSEEIDSRMKKELSKYGITEEACFIRKLQQTQRKIIISCMLGLALTGGVLILCFIVYLRQRQKQLNQLSNYMNQVAMGHYALDLANNSEDELSNLKNQLFKLTLAMREQAEKSVQQKKALADSVSDISHQLKTPLTSASILLDNLMDSKDMDAGTRERFIRETTRQVQSMNWMILSMLKLSRLDAGVVEFEMEPFSLRKMMKEAADNLDVIAELKSVTISFLDAPADNRQNDAAQPHGIILYGDYNWNREAFQNILKNALEHSPVGEKVFVKTEDNGVYTAITVTNFGKTISPDEQKQIFLRHYSTANPTENNMGIGLPLAKAILERQNGYLAVASENGRTDFTMKYLKTGQQ